MGFSAPAQAQTNVWLATLTVQSIGGVIFGCSNDSPGSECSTTSILSDDDFTYDSTDYTIHTIFLTNTAQLQLYFTTDLAAAAQTLTLDVAGTTFAFEDATTKAARHRFWSRSGLSWSGGDTVGLKLTEKTPTVPGAPVLTATANGETQIDLSWTVPDTGGRALDKYSIDVSADGGTTWAPLADTGGTITTYSHTGLTGGTTRHYRVAAVNPIGTGAWSNVANATTEGGNAAPTFTDGASTTRSVAENATASTNIGTAVAATDADSGDTLEYTLGGTDAASFAIVSTSGQLQTSAALDFETKSSYAVTVSVSDGNGGTDSIGVTITVTDVNEPPATPGAPTVSATANSDTSLDVSWTAPGLNGGPAITGYHLQYRQGTTGPWTNGPQNVSGTSTAIADLTAGTAYQVQVRALNGETPSDWSPSGTGSTSSATNNAPTFTEGTSTTRSVAENTASSQNIGTAIAATDADSGDTLEYTLGGTDNKSFDIHLNTGQLLTQTALDFETKSSYAVTVSVSDGNSGTDSIDVTITVTDVDEQPGRPAAPSVGATANVHTSLDVSWTAPGLNGGPAITGYDLQYRPGTSGSFTNGPQNVSGTSAAITGLAAGTSYQVQVRALNGETPSDWSSVGTGSTLAAATAPEVPRTLTAAPGDGQVVLTWTVPANTVSAILRYEHRYKVTSATNFPATWTSAGMALTATVGSLTNGTPYSFEVRAVNTVGAGPAATTSATPTATTRATDPTLTLAAGPTRFGEADGSVQICVVPSAVSTQRITVQVATADGTATAPDDYGSHSGTVALQPNQQRACFTVTLVDDAEVEGDETFTVTLSNPVNATLGTRAVATVTIVDDEIAANVAPTFNEGDSTTRSVAENTAPRTNIGTAIAATDADSGDTLRYTLDGTDFKSFSIHTETGQLLTLAPLDFETKSSYAVTVSVADGNGGTDSIDVTINVTDEDAPPPPPAPDPPGPDPDPDPEPPPAPVPAAPENVTRSELDGIQPVTVSWEPVDGADTYTVWFYPPGHNYTKVTDTSWTTPELQWDRAYAASVRAVNEHGPGDWGARVEWRTAPEPERTAPMFERATIDGATLTVTFNEDLDEGSTPASHAFTVSGERTGTGTVAVSGVTVTVTLNAAVPSGEIVTVSYTKPRRHPLRDADGNEVADFTGQPVTNTTPTPVPALPLAGAMGLGLLLLGAGRRVLRARGAGLRP